MLWLPSHTAASHILATRIAHIMCIVPKCHYLGNSRDRMHTISCEVKVCGMHSGRIAVHSLDRGQSEAMCTIQNFKIFFKVDVSMEFYYVYFSAQ